MELKSRFWRRWVVANAVAEMVGLGLVAALGWLVFRAAGTSETPAAVLGQAALLVALGGVEGIAVGWAQARVLRERLPGLRGWALATVIGAVAAWLVGMVPSTIMNLQPHPAAAAPPEIPLGVRLLLAAGLGLVAGPILAAFQFRVLRRSVRRAGGWLIANALAWALGMPVIFAGIHAAYAVSGPAATVAVLAGTLLSAGAVVGAVHGMFLMRLLRPENRVALGRD